MKLEEIVGSRSKISLLRYLSKSNDWEFNLASIGKKTGLDKGSISKIIKEFEKKNIVDVRRSGKLLLFKLNKKHAPLVKKVFRAEVRWAK